LVLRVLQVPSCEEEVLPVHLGPSCLVEVQTLELVAAAGFSFCLAILESGHGVLVFAAADTVPVNACQGRPSPS